MKFQKFDKDLVWGQGFGDGVWGWGGGWGEGWRGGLGGGGGGGAINALNALISTNECTDKY